MGYRIEYRKDNMHRSNGLGWMRLPLLTVLCFVLFVALVEVIWPDGASLMQKAAFYSRGVIPVAALDELASELHCGQTIMSAIGDFCRKMVS